MSWRKYPNLENWVDLSDHSKSSNLLDLTSSMEEEQKAKESSSISCYDATSTNFLIFLAFLNIS